jgi:hypothetical protein
MNYAANFIDKFTVQSTKAIFHEEEIKELAVTVLKDFKLEIHKNPEHYVHANEKHFSKYVYNKTIINKLLETTVNNIDDLFDDINLKKKEELQDQFDIVMTGKTYSNLRKELCKQDSSEISYSILKRIQKYPEWDMTECYKNRENKGYEIFVDETLKNNIAEYGIFCKKDSKYNYFSRVEGE